MKLRLLATSLVLAGTTSLSMAATTTVAAFNLGEDDAGAVNGGAGNNPTTAFIGTNLPIGAGDPTYSNNTPGGASTLSMSFDDDADYYGGAGPVDLGADNWGMEGWVYSTDAGNGGWAFANGRYFIGQFGGNFLWHRNGQGNANAATIPVVADEWHHMGLVRDGGVLTAYFDGAAIASTNRTDSWDFGAAIGARGHDGRETWAGEVDAVRFFTFEPGQFDPATDLRATFIPEPSSVALLGLAGLVLFRRRRQ